MFGSLLLGISLIPAIFWGALFYKNYGTDNSTGRFLSPCVWTDCQALSECPLGRNLTNITDCDSGGSRSLCCPSCSWTGCEADEMRVKGCKHRGMEERGREVCGGGGGHNYLCCPMSQDQLDECWMTGCQLDAWNVTGCEQYGRTSLSPEGYSCDDSQEGRRYFCCPHNTTVVSQPEPEIEPTTGNYTDCLWSSCMPKNMTEGFGCPSDAVERERQDCDEHSVIFHCCFRAAQLVPQNELDEEEHSPEDLARYLLLRSRNFTATPDQLPCVMLDPAKLAVLQVKDEGLRICDLCPRFPQRRLSNVFIDTMPARTEHGILFGECFGLCFSMPNCVAYSYDHGEAICYLFNSTIGTIKSESSWTTVLMTQPTGLLNAWSYVRHTSVLGSPYNTTSEAGFLSCLEKCQRNPHCVIISYSLITTSCALFNSTENTQYVDLNYGFISAFNLRQVLLGADVFWRFSEVASVLPTDDHCSKTHDNGTHSAYFSKSCFTNPHTGCDVETGCKLCYYPQKTAEQTGLGPCRDQRQETRNELEREMTSCLGDDSCMGVGYEKSQQMYQHIRMDTLNNRYDASYMLRYPKLNTGLHQYLDQYEFLPDIQMTYIPNSKSNFQISLETSYKECLERLQRDDEYTKASYSFSLKLCHLGDTKVMFQENKEERYMTIIQKPGLQSSLKNFIKTPGVRIVGKAHLYSGCEAKCEEECASQCKHNCSYVVVTFHVNRTDCYFFEKNNDTTNIVQSNNSVTLVKQSHLDFSLESFNKLSPFQNEHFYGCFAQDSHQTQTSLTSYASNTTAPSNLRKKRGLFDFIGDAFKAVGNFIVDTVVDTVVGAVTTVVDTAKGVVNTVSSVVQGDWEGAADAFLNIPIVHDVQNAVELGGAVLSGDWDAAKEKGLELLESKCLDMAMSVIPGGKVVSMGAKAAGKALNGVLKVAKKGAETIKRNVNKVINRFESKNKKVRDQKHKETGSINERGTCQTRTKRAAKKKGGGKKVPGKCKENDDDKDTKFCRKPLILNAIKQTLDECGKKTVGAVCNYECEPGYLEENPRVACKKAGKILRFPGTAKCKLETCGAGPYPLVALRTPQSPAWYRPSIGKYVTVYVVLFDKKRKLPIWSIAMQQADLVNLGSFSYNKIKNFKRHNRYLNYPCKALKEHQATKADYKGSGWDHGHLTPANIARWSHKSKKLINLYLNLAPQDSWTNSFPWQTLEAHVECFSGTHQTLVATGLCLDGATQKIKAKSDIVIPKCFWKMICYKDEKGKEQVVGFMHKNTKVGRSQVSREKEVFTAMSQDSIKAIMTDGQLHLIKNPWLMATTHVYQGRGVDLIKGTGSPVNPLACGKVKTLPDAEKKAWEKALWEQKKKTSWKQNIRKKKPQKKPVKKKPKGKARPKKGSKKPPKKKVQPRKIQPKKAPEKQPASNSKKSNGKNEEPDATDKKSAERKKEDKASKEEDQIEKKTSTAGEEEPKVPKRDPGSPVDDQQRKAPKKQSASNSKESKGKNEESAERKEDKASKEEDQIEKETSISGEEEPKVPKRDPGSPVDDQQRKAPKKQSASNSKESKGKNEESAERKEDKASDNQDDTNKKRRNKREEEIPIKRGCHKAGDFEEKLALLDYFNFRPNIHDDEEGEDQGEVDQEEEGDFNPETGDEDREYEEDQVDQEGEAEVDNSDPLTELPEEHDPVDQGGQTEVDNSDPLTELPEEDQVDQGGQTEVDNSDPLTELPEEEHDPVDQGGQTEVYNSDPLTELPEEEDQVNREGQVEVDNSDPLTELPDEEDQVEVDNSDPLTELPEEEDLSENVVSCKKRIVGYYTSWLGRKISTGHLSRLTHVIFAYFEMRADGSVSKISTSDEQAAGEQLQRLLILSRNIRTLKVMFAVGGPANSQYFSQTAATPEKRIRFIGTVIKLMEDHDFDGVDINWEHPGTGEGNVSNDKNNYIVLLRELREALDGFASTINRKTKFVISFAGAAKQDILEAGYDLPGLFRYADFSNVMSHDYSGAWGPYTSSVAPLFASVPSEFSWKTNVDWTMKYYVCKTKSPHKINMGISFYGRMWANIDLKENLNNTTVQPGFAVNGILDIKHIGWNEIKKNYLVDGNLKVYFDSGSHTSYAFNTNTKTFIGYEDMRSLADKKNYAVDKNLGGLTIWSVEQDDDEFTLLKTIASTPLCNITDPTLVNHKCSPVSERRWWLLEDGGRCGRSAPLYRGFYPVCDPDDPGHRCCGASGVCGSGAESCNCPTCVDYGNFPEKILEPPTKPAGKVGWFFSGSAEGGLCGKLAPLIDGTHAACNRDDDNAFCCSSGGRCGNTPLHCDCAGCVNYRGGNTTQLVDPNSFATSHMYYSCSDSASFVYN